MASLKDLFGITIGSSFLPTVFGAIGSSGLSTSFQSALGGLTSVGFIGNVASKFKFK